MKLVRSPRDAALLLAGTPRLIGCSEGGEPLPPGTGGAGRSSGGALPGSGGAPRRGSGGANGTGGGGEPGAKMPAVDDVESTGAHRITWDMPPLNSETSPNKQSHFQPSHP